MKKSDIKAFMDEKVKAYNHPEFLDSDPIQIPHNFTRKEDIEISAFLTATIAWGNRKTIIKNASHLMRLLDQSPYEFVMCHTASDLDCLQQFTHRTFNGTDLTFFIRGLQHIYTNKDGLEGVFANNADPDSTQCAITALKKEFLSIPHPLRSAKHLPDPARGSAAKRLNMFLRWMVRKDNAQVDFGLWTKISPSQLSCPLDVHSGNVARKLGLLKRRQNDARAVGELDRQLRLWDAEDPVRYDFALFGLGVFENWS